MHNNTHVLIIEDDPVSIDVLSTLLHQLGVRTTVITLGIGSDFDVTALDAADPPDAVFLDLQIPGINGYGILQALQSIPAFAAVPVVAYSTHTSHLNRAREAGFHSFLGKPLNAAHFRDQLADILNNVPVWEVP
jgi:CheY-like chemotaxis protein